MKIQFGAGTRASWDRCYGLRMGRERPDRRAARVCSKLLTQWGYSNPMDALSADEWEQRISANAMQLNPLDLLGGIDGSTTDGTRSGAIVRIRREDV